MKWLADQKKRVIFICGLLLLVAVGVTLAFYTNKQDFTNEFHVDSPGVAIHEIFNPSDHWVPEEEKKKIVGFDNTGGQDMVLRFKIKAEWAPNTWTSEELLLLEATDYNDPLKALNFYWNIGPGNVLGNDAKDSDGNSTREWHENDTTGPVDFVLMDDGYYYYTKVLKAGASTPTILESVQFSPNLSNDEHGLNFSNRQINVTLSGETVLALDNAARDKWKHTFTEDENTGVLTWSKVN